MSDAADQPGAAPLSAADRERVEAEVRRMVADYRARPTQEKEDELGLAVAVMPPPEREHVTTALLRLLVEERGGPRRAMPPTDT